MQKFSTLVAEELVPPFLKTQQSKMYQTISVHYQKDISEELRDAVTEVLIRDPDMDQLQSTIDDYSPPNVKIDICVLSKEQKEIRLQFTKIL